MADWQLEDRTPGKTITGPQGPQGPMGPQGPQGVKGNDGSQGPKGDQGAQGFAGPAGARGPAGADGARGLQGPQGQQGPQGEIGPRGSQGAQGDVGPRGNTGPQGQQGPQGGVGPKGDKGDTGDTGPKGDQGVQGVQGPKGDQGIQGAQGVKGDQGAGVSIKGSRATPNDLPATGNSPGDTYVMTTSGSGFTAGDGYSYDGAQFVNVGQIRGPQGPQGVAGNTGAQGPKGDTGAQGAQGPKGDTGAAGSNGADGAQGIQGPKGDKGDTGPQGAQGVQGVKGDTGAQGPKGDTGATGPAPDTSVYARLGVVNTFTANQIIKADYAQWNITQNGGTYNGQTWAGVFNGGDGSFILQKLKNGSLFSNPLFVYENGAITTAQLGDLKTYIDNGDNGRLAKSGGSVTGQINLDFTSPTLGFRNTDTSKGYKGEWYLYNDTNTGRFKYDSFDQAGNGNASFSIGKGGDIFSAQMGDLKSYMDNRGVPAGVVADYAGANAPAGWLKCNGAAVSRSAYAALFAAIGTQYGAGDGSTTFNLPDSRGYFRRSLDDGRGIDPNRNLGSTQGDALRNHTHGFNVRAAGASGAAVFVPTSNSADSVFNTTGASGGTGSPDETRPVNIAFLAIIKY